MVGHEADTGHQRRQHVGAGADVSLLQIVCAWCQQHIVWHRVQTPMPFQSSYSICAHCYAAVARELEPLTADAALPGLRAE
jgi:hypothetical protein